MANIPLKSLKFPGLDDTYTIAAEEAADIADLKSATTYLDTVAIDDYQQKNAALTDLTESATKTTGKYMSSDGSPADSSLWNYYTIAVTLGDRYHVVADTVSNAYGVLLLDVNDTVVAKYPSQSPSTLESITVDLTVPQNAVKMVVNERTSTSGIVICKVYNYVYRHNAAYIQKFGDLFDSDPILSVIPSTEITEKANYYLADGVETPSSLWRIMTISVERGQRYQVSARFYGNAKGVTFFDASDAVVSIVGSESDDVLHTFDVVVPDTAVKMSINDKKSTGFAIKKYVYPINNEKIIINNRNIAEIINSIGSSGNVLYAKTLVTVGDSITYGADMDAPGIAPNGDLMTYGWQIANRNSMTFYNRGVAGSTLAAGTNRNGFAEENGRYTQLPNEIDYLTIWFGWNDNACISDNLETLGAIDSTDTNSFYGAYNTVLPYLIDKYPNTRIGLIVPFGASAAVRKAVRDIGEKWGLSVFDNYTGNTPLYYGKENEAVLASGLLADRRAVWQANGAHPSYAGHCQLATQIEAWLRTL